jgi:hypothetical protein
MGRNGTYNYSNGKVKGCIDCPAMIPLGRSNRCAPCSSLHYEKLAAARRVKRYAREKAARAPK